jgi:hypothetical protein
MRPIIVCGTGRSGTSIFTKMLGLHPKIWAFRWESQIFSGIPGLVDLLDSNDPVEDLARFRAAAVGRMFKRNVRGSYHAGLFEIISLPAWRKALDVFGKRLLLAKTREERAAACRSLSGSLFVPPTRQAGKTRWAEKTPRNLLCASEIAEIHPNSLFVNVVRDGRDVTASILEKKFWPVARSGRYLATSRYTGVPVFDTAVDYWTSLIDIGRQHEERLGPSRWHNVRLEDILREPRSTLSTVCAFLGLDDGPQALAEMVGEIRAEDSHENRWKTDLTPEQIEAVTRISEDNLRRFGYV